MGNRVLLLGESGMLGSMVGTYLRRMGHDVIGTQRQNPSAPLYLDAAAPAEGLTALLEYVSSVDLIINCIGITTVRESIGPAQLARAIFINGVFPHFLQTAATTFETRVLHMSTDGVFAGRPDAYDEASPCDATDRYGISKRLGESSGANVLSIRCSILGPEQQGNRSLLQWFLSQAEGSTVQGFTNHVWNGVTTLQFAQLCEKLLTGDNYERLRSLSPIFHFSPNLPLSKYELICLCQHAFQKDVQVAPSEAPVAITRILRSKYAHVAGLDDKQRSMKHAIDELSEFVASTQ